MEFFKKKFSNLIKSTSYEPKLFNNISFTFRNKENILNQLCNKYGCDKGFFKRYEDVISWKPHSYTDLYYFLFGNQRTTIKLVFELGVGTNKTENNTLNRRSKPGASLRVWKDFFFNAKIFGADIDKTTLFREKRIETFLVDQFDTESIKKMWKEINKRNFDLIIDDGCHQFKGTINFFENSIKYLNKTGFYIIEDIFYKDKKKMLEFFKESNYDFFLVELSSKFHHKDNNLFVVKK